MPIGSIVGGLIGQSGSQAGGDMAWGAANQANQQNQAEATRGRNAMTPWTGSGTSALSKITQLLGLGELTQRGNNDGIYWVDPNNRNAFQQQALSEFQTSPGYQFRLDEGVKARDRGASARGMINSGAQQKAIDTYGQNVASEEFNNYLGHLFNAAGMGGTAQAGANSTSGNLVAGGSNALYQGGKERGSAYAAGANALASGIGSATNSLAGIAAYKGWI